MYVHSGLDFWTQLLKTLVRLIHWLSPLIKFNHWTKTNRGHLLVMVNMVIGLCQAWWTCKHSCLQGQNMTHVHTLTDWRTKPQQHYYIPSTTRYEGIKSTKTSNTSSGVEINIGPLASGFPVGPVESVLHWPGLASKILKTLLLSLHGLVLILATG